MATRRAVSSLDVPLNLESLPYVDCEEELSFRSEIQTITLNKSSQPPKQFTGYLSQDTKLDLSVSRSPCSSRLLSAPTRTVFLAFSLVLIHPQMIPASYKLLTQFCRLVVGVSGQPLASRTQSRTASNKAIFSGSTLFFL